MATPGEPPWKGLDTSRPPIFISYDQAERMLFALLLKAQPWRPEAVVGIARSGLIPGTMAASMLALPLFILNPDRAAGTIAWLGEPPPHRRLLVVDDSCSTGRTLQRAAAFLHRQDYATLTLTIVHDPEVARFAPDLSHAMTALFRLPWDRGEATPSARALRAAGAETERYVAEAPFIGLDLDGIFLPDLPLADYAADLQAALARRHALDPCPVLPPFAPDRAVVITGRPEMDRAMTEAWLARCGHAGLPLECRPPEVGNDAASIAGYKAQAATRWGCTHFIESEPDQAIRIAALAPHLIVSWWSLREARAWIIGAATPPM